jgi:hypothetical protein
MSDMTSLFKAQEVTYRTEVFENFNQIEKYKDDLEDIFGETSPVPYRIQGSFKTKFKSSDENVFLENYGNQFAELHMKRKTLVVEENENKIALKLFVYNNYRDVSKRFFKVRKEINYLTFNIKRKTFYSGELRLKKKKKIGSKMVINKTDLNGISVYNQMMYFHTNLNDSDNLKFKNEVINIFLNRVAERMEVKFDKEGLSPEDKFYQLHLKFSSIKYPDAFSKFKTFYTPKKEIRQHDNNLVTWFMNKHNIKGTKIREILNRYNNIDINGLIIFYNLFGIDLFNTIHNHCFLTMNPNNFFGYYGSLIEDISKKEKENIAKILNTTDSETLLNSLNDHIQYKTTLKRYGEHVKITATNYDDYVKEHSEWSTLVQSYRSGTVTRFYGDEAYLIEKPIVSNGDIYYPVLLKTTEQYENESMIQSNCVRTYSEKPYCFIISLRKGSIDSDVRASIEFRYSDDDIRIVQKLGKYNKGLDQEWTSPIYDLELFGKFLYDKKMIKLPEMTKRFPNGKLIKQTAVFKNQDNVHNLYPVWDKNNDEETLFENGFNLYEGLFMDLP